MDAQDAAGCVSACLSLWRLCQSHRPQKKRVAAVSPVAACSLTCCLQLHAALVSLLNVSIALEDPWDNQGLDGIYIDESLFEAEQVRAGRPGSLQHPALPSAPANLNRLQGATQARSLTTLQHGCFIPNHAVKKRTCLCTDAPGHRTMTTLGLPSVTLAGLVLTGNCSPSVEPAAADA